MRPTTCLALSVIVFTIAAADIRSESLKQARYIEPVERYGHFALGRPHEYGRVTAMTDEDRKLELTLPEDEVFEDLAPRRVTLSAGQPERLLSIVSHRDEGARLVLIGAAKDGEGLEIVAESPPVGRPMRWLNPVGTADLDGDGYAEIAAVITPHIGGILKVYRQRGRSLVEVAALGGYSNHVYGSSELLLSVALRIAGRNGLLVPDAERLSLRLLFLQPAGLVEHRQCPLPSPVNGKIEVLPDDYVSVGLESGWHTLSLHRCKTVGVP